MKPSQTPDTTAVFLMVLARPITVASTSLPVAVPRTTSSSFMTWAGLKKCVPITSAGRRVSRASAFTSRVEVLVARIAPGFIVSSRVLNTACFTAMSSNTASTTMSACGHVGVAQGGTEEAHALLDLGGGELALARAAFVALADGGEPLVERLAAGLQQR